MTDKVQKIKEWISKEQDGLMDAQGNFEYPEHEGAYHTLCSLENFINSLEVKEVDLEEEYHEFLKREWFGKPGKTISEQMFFTAQYFTQWQRQKSINKTVKWLKENARLYLITHRGCIDDYDDKTLIEDFRKVLEEE